MLPVQPGILPGIPTAARYLSFSIGADHTPRQTLQRLAAEVNVQNTVVGVGLSTLNALGSRVAGMQTFPEYAGVGFDVPSTPAALWLWLRGDDRGELVHRTRALAALLQPAFVLDQVIDAFRYGVGLDLSGYEDGTENPRGKDALDAAVVQGQGRGLDGSSFVAVQQWVHDLGHFQSLAAQEQDRIIGRRRADNEELADAPPSAHVKRTAQESFDPEAFVLRRSMPWADSTRQGLVFVAFGKSFAAFEAQLRRMVGAEDAITDGLFRFTRPVTGSYFWCPPVAGGKLDFSLFDMASR